MGRTVSTYVQLISEQAAKWTKFRGALRRENQLHFDRLIAGTRYYSPAGTFQTFDDPRESIVLSMLLDLQKRVAAIEGRLKIGLPNDSQLMSSTRIVESGGHNYLIDLQRHAYNSAHFITGPTAPVL
jgi:hypothetical protein